LVLIFCLLSCSRAGLGINRENTGDVKCSLCQLIVTYVEDFVEKNQSEAFIIKELEHLCAALPGAFRQPCDQIVEQYAPQLIHWLIKKENPDAFCSSVKLCPSLTNELPEPIVVVEEKKKPLVQSSPKFVAGAVGCTICQTVALYVEKWMAENSTEQSIIDRLEVFCSALGPASPECKSIVATYLPQLIAWIEAKESPLVFCSQVGLCTGETQSSVQQPRLNGLRTQKRSEEQGACPICEMVVTYVEQLVAQNNTIAEIVAKVEEVCNLLPSPGSSFCDSLAQQYVPQLVQWILNKENPQNFCTSIGFCSKE